MTFSRRALLASMGLAPLLGASPERYRVGITSNTRGGWEKDVFLSFREAREVGYRNVESFIHYFVDYWERPQDLQKKLDEIGVKFVTISNGNPMEMAFEDPAKHEKLLADHVRLARFIKALGCDHLKINMGRRRPEGTTPEDLRHMATVLNELGRRTREEGIQLAAHAHMWSQFENQREIDYIMEHTEPKRVAFVLDTGHVNMAGIDPVKLAKSLGNRVIEYHLKDTAREHRGGAKQRIAVHEPMTNPIFFPLGEGGVDFPALFDHLNQTQWRGWLTVELDSSPYRPPKESARISREYLEKRLGINV